VPKSYYKNNKAFYEELGISKADFFLMRDWYFDFNTTASPENFKAIVKHRGTIETNIRTDVLIPMAKSLVSSVLEHSFRGYHVLLMAVLLLAGIILLDRRWLRIALTILILGFGAYGYLFYLGRPIYRASYIVEISACLWLLYSIDTSWLKPNVEHWRIAKLLKRYAVYPVLCVVLLFPLAMGAYGIADRSEEKWLKEGDALWEYTVSQKENYFVFDIGTIGLYLSITSAYNYPMKPMPPDYLGNIGAFGGWETMSPYGLRAQAEYGLSNVYADIIDNERVYVVDNSTYERAEQFFNDHYAKPGETIYYEPVKEIGGFKIWQVKSKKE
jgi:hypothetical protein